VLIVLFTFISGMHFEDINASSVFVCTAAEPSNSYMSSLDSDVEDIQVCTKEMLGAHEYIEVGQLITQFTHLRVNSKQSRNNLIFVLFFLNEGKSYANCERVQFVSKKKEDLVVNHIHKSDGKKKI